MISGVNVSEYSSLNFGSRRNAIGGMMRKAVVRIRVNTAEVAINIMPIKYKAGDRQRKAPTVPVRTIEKMSTQSRSLEA